MLNCRNIGKFKVDNKILEGAIVQGNHIKESELFVGMVILDVKNELETDYRWYVSIHPSFREVPYGTMIPEYTAKIDSLTGFVEWIEIPFRQQGYTLLPPEDQA